MENREAIEYLNDVRNGIHIPAPGIELPLLNDKEKEAVDLAISALEKQEKAYDEWCPGCKEYDKDRHCCPRFSKVIRGTLDEVEQQRWIPVVHGKWEDKEVIHKRCIEEWQSARCSACGKYHTTPYMYYFDDFKFCPNCGAKMDGERKES